MQNDDDNNNIIITYANILYVMKRHKLFIIIYITKQFISQNVGTYDV